MRKPQCSPERHEPQRIDEIQDVNATDWRQPDLLGNRRHDADDCHTVFSLQDADNYTHEPRQGDRNQEVDLYGGSHCPTVAGFDLISDVLLFDLARPTLLSRTPAYQKRRQIGKAIC